MGLSPIRRTTFNIVEKQVRMEFEMGKDKVCEYHKKSKYTPEQHRAALEALDAIKVIKDIMVQVREKNANTRGNKK